MSTFLTIGSLRLPSSVLLAPMAGYSDLPFRTALRALGGLGLAYSEMVNAHGLLLGKGQKLKSLLATAPEERPLGYQLYGHDQTMLAEAARKLVDLGAALIDINMGCPQKKIARRGSGAGLLRNHLAASKLAASVVQAVKVPVTVKMRAGWDSQNSAALVPALEDAGVAAITIHGRTGIQQYAGTNDWAAIRQAVAGARRIPIIGNGDITAPATAQAMLAATGCAGIMVGRAALKDPWLIRDIAASLSGRAALKPTRQERCAFFCRHFDAMLAQHGERIGRLLFQRWIPQYSRGFNLGKEAMISLLRISSAETLRQRFLELAQ